MPTGAISIDSALPGIRGSGNGTDHAITSHSGHSTSISPAPKTLTGFPLDTFQQCLQSPALQQALHIQLNDIATETSHNLATEGDIGRATALYLVHDVDLNFDKLLSDLHIRDQYQGVG